VLVLGCHGGMFDHNTMRVLTSFRIVFLTFNLCFRQVSSDSSKGANVVIVRAIALYYQKDITLACCFVDLVPGHREVIMKVAKGNILKEKP
jgi:hypothetical protein